MFSKIVSAVGCNLLVIALLSNVSGCQSAKQPPKTYPVTGKVIYKGGQPLTGGAVAFTQPNSTDGSTSVAGRIQDDGSFALETMVDTIKVAGAPPGDYQVNITPLMGQDQSFEPIRGPKGTFKVEAKEDNNFTFEVEKIKGRH